MKSSARDPLERRDHPPQTGSNGIRRVPPRALTSADIEHHIRRHEPFCHLNKIRQKSSTTDREIQYCCFPASPTHENATIPRHFGDRQSPAVHAHPSRPLAFWCCPSPSPSPHPESNSMKNPHPEPFSDNGNPPASRSNLQHPRRGTFRKQFFLCLLSASGAYLFVIFALAIIPPTSAQIPTPTITCSPTVSPTASATQTPAPSATCTVSPALTPIPSPALTSVPGPQPDDGTTLQWRIYEPQNSGAGPWPAILLIHGGGFSAGDPVGGAIGTIATNLAAIGYHVAVPTYRLAPWGLITGQPCHQTSDEYVIRPTISNTSSRGNRAAEHRQL